MPEIETAVATEAYRKRCEDRVAVLGSEDRTVIVVADGAGGLGSGDVAAASVLSEVESALPCTHAADQWVEALHQIDCRISCGESTAVVVDIRPYGIAGASVGDSKAWVFGERDIRDLTAKQARKPLLGSGSASAVPFMHAALDGLLLVATDGLFNYVKTDDLQTLVSRSEFYSIPRRCIDMVRLPSGDLWDDVGVVAARVRPRHQTRRRYAI